MKKCLIVLTIMLSCCMFFSCKTQEPKSNEFIMLSISNLQDGQVQQSLHFTLGTEKLKQNGASDLEVETIKKGLINNVTLFRDEFYISFMLTYNANPNPEYKIGQKLLISLPTYNEESDTVGFSMLFTSMDTWNYYHPSSSGGNDNDTQIGFMIKSSSTGKFPFASQIGEQTVGERYAQAYTKALSAAPNVKQEYNPDFVYDYATYLSVIKSDSEYKIDNSLHHHIWMRKLSEYKEKDSINIYTIQANRGLWYLTILALTLAGLTVAIIIIKVKEKRRLK